MDNTYIWEIDMAQLGADTGIQLEIFSGRDKYTKAGLFSGPLRRQEIDPHSKDAAIRFLFSMTGATQTGKNTFRLSDTAVSRLLQYFEQRQMSGVYCRLQDKKRHRVKVYIGDTGTQKGLMPLIYDSKSGALVYPLPKSAAPPSPHALEKMCSTIKPVPHLYLNMEEKQIHQQRYADADLFYKKVLSDAFVDSIGQKNERGLNISPPFSVIFFYFSGKSYRTISQFFTPNAAYSSFVIS